jgi:hypothetical protein
MPRRVDEGELIASGDRLGVEENAPRVHVAEVDHRPGAIGIHRPEVMEADRVAVEASQQPM